MRLKSHIFCSIAAAVAPILAQAGIERTDGSFELIDSSDVSLFQMSSIIAAPIADWELDVSLSASDFTFDYKPVDFDFNGSDITRDEQNYALQLNGRKLLNEQTTLLLGAGTYDGFSNYRSAWLDEYYRQQFNDLTGVPGAELYQTASPKGINGNIGLRWMYRPSNAFAQLTVSQLQDDVAPGYEIDFDGLQRGQLALATTAISLSTENILTKRIRSLVSLRASQTSQRSWRYGSEIAFNVALAERWIARLQVGGTTEGPTFDAYYGNLAVEFAINERISMYLDGRYYDDTGEIENSFLFSSAAPGTSSRKFGLGIKWTNETWSGRFYVAPISSHFEAPGGNVDAFQNLYKDRDWTVFQLAFSRTY